MPGQIATATHLDRAGLEEFVRPRHHGILLTTRSDGGPQLSPVTLGLSARGQVVISTYPERAKTANLRRGPAASVCVLSEDFNGPWVQLDGIAEVIDPPESVEPLVEYYRCIAGEHPDWDEYREAMRRQAKSLIRISIQRWGPVATGGFPARLAED